MYKNKKFIKIMGIAIIALMLVSAIPGRTVIAAGTAAPGEEIVDVSLKNKGPSTINVTFLGLNVYNFNLAPGTTKVQMVRGTYQTSYYGCGGLQVSNATLKPKNNDITFEDCNKWTPTSNTNTTNNNGNSANNTIQFTIRNKSFRDVQVTLLGGPDNYVLDAKATIRSRFQVLPGPYQYSYYACGKLNVGPIQIKNKGKELIILDCFTNQNTAENAPATHRALTIRNRQYITMEIAFTGIVESYNLTAPAGNTTYYVFKGPYTYAYYACGEVYIGVVNVKDKKGGELIITECGTDADGNALTGEQIAFHVKNNTRETMVIQLRGPQTYIYTVAGSGADLIVTKGFYEYTIWACGTTYNGVLNVATGNVLLKSPYCKGSGNSSG